MTLRLNKRQIILILSIFLLSGILVVTIFSLLYQPTIQQLNMKKSELNSDKKGLAILQNKVNQMGRQTFESSIPLQKKVPVKSLTDQLILQFEKAEIVSASAIKEISFTDSDETAMNQQGDSDENQFNLNNSNNTTQKETKEKIPLPTGVKSITATFTVESPSYFELENFIRELQSLPRIITIDYIEFNGPVEITSVDQQKQTLSVQITASAFYMPELQNLTDELPKLVVPPPSNKKNPFANFPEIERDNS